MSQDILIIVNCELPVTNGQLPAAAVQMFAADPKIVLKNSQGSTELGIQVPPETNLRWRAVPLQIMDADSQAYSVIITQALLWGANPATNQLDAYQYLGQWFANGGTAYGAGYSQNSQNLNFTDPAQGSSSSSQQLGVTKVTHSDPFIQATCNGAMSSPNQSVAYSFTCTVYKNGVQYATVSWDPYVTVY